MQWEGPTVYYLWVHVRISYKLEVAKLKEYELWKTLSCASPVVAQFWRWM